MRDTRSLDYSPCLSFDVRAKLGCPRSLKARLRMDVNSACSGSLRNLKNSSQGQLGEHGEQRLDHGSLLQH